MTKQEINKAIIYEEIGIKALCARKLKEIISPMPSNSMNFIEQEILICDKEKVYGIIVLNKPILLDKDQFNSHFSRHIITEEFKDMFWSDVYKFNAFSFRIKKIFKEPLQYIYMGKEKLAMGKFIEGVTIMKENIDYADVSKAISIIEYEDRLETLKTIEVEDEDKELQKLFLELYELFLKRFTVKARHPGTCPAGMHRNSQGRCVRITSNRSN